MSAWPGTIPPLARFLDRRFALLAGWQPCRTGEYGPPRIPPPAVRRVFICSQEAVQWAVAFAFRLTRKYLL